MSSTSPPLPDPALALHRDSVLAESYKDSNGADQARLRRVLWFNEDSRKVVLFDIVGDRKLHQPYFDDLDAIQQLIRSGHYQLTKYVLPEFALRPDDYVAPNEVLQAKWKRMIDFRDRTWEMILPLLDPQLEPEIYSRSTRGPMVLLAFTQS